MSVKITAKLLKAIRGDKVANDEFVATEIERLNSIQRRVRSIDAKMEQARKRLRYELAKLEADKQAVYNTCDHLDTTYHGDPAGGSDSTTACNICGYVDVEREYRRS